MVHPYNGYDGILFNHKKEQASDTCNNMSEFLKVLCLVTEDPPKASLYVSIYITLKKEQNYQKEDTSVVAKNKYREEFPTSDGKVQWCNF